MKMFRKEEGFTLVELMVVVLIIGILIAIAVPVFNAAKGNAQKKSCFASQRTVEGAYQTWQADAVDSSSNGTITYPTNWDTLMTELEGQYVKAEPVCPAGGTYSATFPTNAVAVVDCNFADPDHTR